MFKQIQNTPSGWEKLDVHQYLLNPGVIKIDDTDMVFSDPTHIKKSSYRSDITYFFRYSELFNGIARYMLKKPEKQSILCLPSSVGCEPYSLGILFEEMAQKGIHIEHQIFATDISENKLRAAASGAFPQALCERLTPEQKANFTIDTATKTATINPQIRDQITFLSASNILTDLPFEQQYNIIMCLNFLLYVDSPFEQEQALVNLANTASDMIVLNYGGLNRLRNYAKTILKGKGFEPNPLYDDLGLLGADIFLRQPS